MPEPTPQKAMFQIFTGALRVETKALPDGTSKKVLKATASSTIKDRHGDEFTPECVQKMTAQAKAGGMTIFLNHRYSVPEDVFGSTTDASSQIRVDGFDTYTDMDLEIAVNETNPRAMATVDALEAGTKLGVSVGCLINAWHPRDPKDTWGFDGMIIEDSDLLEASVVGIPANPRSWIQGAVKAIRKSLQHPDDEDSETLELLNHVATSDGHTNSLTITAATACPSCGGTERSSKGNCADNFHDVTSESIPETQKTSGPEDEATVDDQPAEAQPAVEDAGAEEEPTEPIEDAPSQDAVSQQMHLTLESAITQIAAFKSERAAWVTERTQLTAERDEAREGLRIASQIVEKIASLPLGRKTRFVEATTEFRTKLAGVYDEDFLKFLERNPEP